MHEKNNKLQYLTYLESSSALKVIEGVKLIKKTGNIEYLPFLIQKVNQNKTTEEGKYIMSFLHGFKDSNAVPYYIEAIEKPANSNILKELIQFCWENEFNFAEHIKTFITILIEKDYEIALEAFTVVEENIFKLSDEQKQEYATFLKEKLSAVAETKKALVVELIKLIEN